MKTRTAQGTCADASKDLPKHPPKDLQHEACPPHHHSHPTFPPVARTRPGSGNDHLPPKAPLLTLSGNFRRLPLPGCHGCSSQSLTPTGPIFFCFACACLPLAACANICQISAYRCRTASLPVLSPETLGRVGENRVGPTLSVIPSLPHRQTSCTIRTTVATLPATPYHLPLASGLRLTSFCSRRRRLDYSILARSFPPLNNSSPTPTRTLLCCFYTWFRQRNLRSSAYTPNLVAFAYTFSFLAPNPIHPLPPS